MSVSISSTSDTTVTEENVTMSKEENTNEISSTSPSGTLNIGEKPKPSKLPGKLKGASLNIPIQLPGMTHPRFREKEKTEEMETEKQKDKEATIKESEYIEPPKLEHATQSRATVT